MSKLIEFGLVAEETKGQVKGEADGEFDVGSDESLRKKS